VLSPRGTRDSDFRRKPSGSLRKRSFLAPPAGDSASSMSVVAKVPTRSTRARRTPAAGTRTFHVVINVGGRLADRATDMPPAMLWHYESPRHRTVRCSRSAFPACVWPRRSGWRPMKWSVTAGCLHFDLATIGLPRPLTGPNLKPLRRLQTPLWSALDGKCRRMGFSLVVRSGMGTGWNTGGLTIKGESQ